ncbi:tenascin-N-like, partial [Nothobranchius furzeri]|uniref:tenascin-N-like n=1 Tax=Nothobranchius furzeri TaxID=105023 RepID=UPI003904DC32
PQKKSSVSFQLVFGPQSQRLVQVTDVSRLVGWESVRRAEYYVLTYHPKFAEGDIGQVQVPNTENSYLIIGLTPGGYLHCSGACSHQKE